ncbi:MAG: Chromosome partition protein Smc [Candidatus Heimdallarchaeota archaeon LC_3]|nr:MAG: Chromosome partition protein Smc [Candidatus Heimdallarchaeota archaeon LC_3]
MANAKPMLQFLSQLNKTKAGKLTDVGIRIDSITKGIKNSPKPNYSQTDIISYLEDSKRLMSDMVNKIFEGFSRTMLPILRGGAPETTGDEDFFLEEEKKLAEFNKLKTENERLKREVVSVKVGSPITTTSGISKEEFMTLQTELNDKEIQLQKKDFEIQRITLENQNSQETIQNYQYKIGQNESKLNEYSANITSLQNELDNITRQKSIFINQLDNSSKEISSYREQIDEIQISASRKEREIRDLREKVDEFQDLENENEKLRQAVVDAADRIKKSATDIKDIQEQARSEISSKENEIRLISVKLETLQEEKELLLIDSQEVSKAVGYYRTEFEKTQKELQSNQSEMEAMEVQLNMLMSGAVSTSSQPSSSPDPLSMLDSISQIDAQDEQFEEIQKQLVTITEERNKSQDEIRRYTAELGHLTSEITELNRTVKRLEADKVGLSQDLDTVKQELDIELEQRRRMQESSNKYRLEKTEIEQKHLELSSEFDSLKASIEGIKRDYERKLKTTDDLDNRIKGLREERDTLESDIKTLNNKNKKYQKDIRELNTKIEDLELEINEKDNLNNQLKKEIQKEKKEKSELIHQLESLSKDLDDVKFKFDLQMKTSTAEEVERNTLLETVSGYRSREADLNKQIIQLKTISKEAQVETDNLKQEINLKEKQIEVHLGRQKELNDVLIKLRSEADDLAQFKYETEAITTTKEVEIETLQRQVNKLEKDINNLEKSLSETKNKLNESSEQNIIMKNEISEKDRLLKSELDTLQESSSKEIEVLQKKFSREKELSEFYKRSLEDDPKYMILLILNEVRKATTKELERTTRRPTAIVKRLVKSLEGEGYLKISADEEMVEMVKNFPPI